MHVSVFMAENYALGPIGSFVQKSFKQLISDLTSGNEQVRKDSVQV